MTLIFSKVESKYLKNYPKNFKDVSDAVRKMEKIYQSGERKSSKRKLSRDKSSSRNIQRHNSIELIPNKSFKYQFYQKLVEKHNQSCNQESCLGGYKLKMSDIKSEVGKQTSKYFYLYF